MHSRAANGVDGEPALPWLMAGGTVQYPVILDEATATRLGYGSTCILGPIGAVTLPQGGGSADLGGRELSEDSGGESEDTTPEVGCTFRMWSDYRMALEGHGSNVQAGTLLAPVLDVSRTVADTFRRRWASGGQYPERTLARVRLAEREDGGRGPEQQPQTPNGNGDGMFANGGNGVERSSFSDPQIGKGVGREGAATQVAIGEKESRRGGSERMEDARRSEEDGSVGNSMNADREEKDAEKEEEGGEEKEGGGEEEGGEEKGGGGGEGGGEKGEEEGEWEGSEDSSDEGHEPPHGGLRQVFSHLNGLNSEMLVERALEDLHDEQEHRLMSSLSSGRPHLVSDLTDGGLESIGRSSTGVDEAALNVAGAALDMSPQVQVSSRALLGTADATADDSLTMVAVSGDPEDEDGTGAATRLSAGSASPAEGAMQTPTEDVFMLPGWHYLALSGRSLAMDFQWTNVDLVLMQDPTAQQGRDTGKNVLALRSSGAITVSSSGAGESVDVQLERASLLPCFYRYKDEAGGEGSGSYVKANGSSTATVAAPPRLRLENGIDKERNTPDVNPARRLAQLLGGGQSALMAVERTWLGQGLVTADSRPLLDPFTVQIGYGTVVARATGGGRGSDTTDGRGLLSGSDFDGDVVRSNTEKGEGRGSADSVHEDEEDEEDGGLGEDTVAGVFRVAVSEVQLLAAASTTPKGSTTVEVEVNNVVVTVFPLV